MSEYPSENNDDVASLALYFGMRDAPGENRTIGWLADVRYRDFPMPGRLTIAGFAQSVSTAVRERDFTVAERWREYGEYSEVNAIPLATETEILKWVPDVNRFGGAMADEVTDFVHHRFDRGNALVKSYCQETTPDEWRFSKNKIVIPKIDLQNGKTNLCESTISYMSFDFLC